MLFSRTRTADASRADDLIERTDNAGPDEGLPEPSQDPSVILDDDQ